MELIGAPGTKRIGSAVRVPRVYIKEGTLYWGDEIHHMGC